MIIKEEDQVIRQVDLIEDVQIETVAVEQEEVEEKPEEPMTLFEAQNQIVVQQQTEEEAEPALNAFQPEMNINSDLTTLNFDPDNSSSSDGRGPFAGPPGLMAGQPSSSEPNYQMFMNAKKAD